MHKEVDSEFMNIETHSVAPPETHTSPEKIIDGFFFKIYLN